MGADVSTVCFNGLLLIEGKGKGMKRGAYFYFQEVLRRTIDLLEALLARIWHCLHVCGIWVAQSPSLSIVDSLAYLLCRVKVGRKSDINLLDASEDWLVGRVIYEVSDTYKSGKRGGI